MEFLPAKLLRFAGKRQLSQTVSVCLSEGIVETRPLPYYYLPWTCPDVLWSCATAGHSVHMTPCSFVGLEVIPLLVILKPRNSVSQMPNSHFSGLRRSSSSWHHCSTCHVHTSSSSLVSV